MTPEPGSYMGMPFEEYLATEAINAGGLCDILVSPLAYKNRTDKDSASKAVGRATHCAILEPAEFARRYAFWDRRTATGNLKKRAGKEYDAWLAQFPPNVEVLTEGQYATTCAIAKAVRQHRVASEALSEGVPEVTYIWEHPRTGLTCKSRLDWVRPGTLYDLKTTSDPRPAEFGRQAANLLYHVRLAFYREAHEVAYGERPDVGIIAAQNDAPWDVVVYSIPEDVLAEGKRLADIAMERYASCLEAGEWPGSAPDEVVTLRLPGWATPTTPTLPAVAEEEDNLPW